MDQELNVANYSNNDILNLFHIHGECNKIVQRTCRTFNTRYPHLPRINERKFRHIEANFRTFGRVKAKKNISRPVTDMEDNEINVLAYFNLHPQSSIRSAERELDISRMSIQRILKKHKLHNFSMRPVQALIPGDYRRRITFCQTMLQKIQEDPGFLAKIIWTDESKFTRQGITNTRNEHYWATDNPHLAKNHNYQHKFSFNVFCIMLGDQISYYIYNENLTSEIYVFGYSSKLCQ